MLKRKEFILGASAGLTLAAAATAGGFMSWPGAHAEPQAVNRITPVPANGDAFTPPPGAPSSFATIFEQVAPAVVRWMDRGRTLTVGDLTRVPESRDSGLGAVPVLLVRGVHRTFLPEASEALERGDRLVMLGSELALDLLTLTLHYDRTLTYLVTGVDEPSSWVWRRLMASG